MTKDLKVLVIIPAYNEAEAILATVRDVERCGYDYVVINDGSRDDTLGVCRANGVNVVDLPQNLGIGGAVQCGHLYARDHGYDIDVQVDGDGQHDPQYISNLLQVMEGGETSLVVGSRFVEKTEGFQSTWLRRLGITWLSQCIHILTGKRVADPTSGFRACNKDAIELFCRDYPVDYPEPESIAVALRSGLTVCEAPVVMKERQGGTSSISGFSSVYYMIKVTLAIVIACLGRRAK